MPCINWSWCHTCIFDERERSEISLINPKTVRNTICSVTSEPHSKRLFVFAPTNFISIAKRGGPAFYILARTRHLKFKYYSIKWSSDKHGEKKNTFHSAIFETKAFMSFYTIRSSIANPQITRPPHKNHNNNNINS